MAEILMITWPIVVLARPALDLRLLGPQSPKRRQRQPVGCRASEMRRVQRCRGCEERWPDGELSGAGAGSLDLILNRRSSPRSDWDRDRLEASHEADEFFGQERHAKSWNRHALWAQRTSRRLCCRTWGVGPGTTAAVPRTMTSRCLSSTADPPQVHEPARACCLPCVGVNQRWPRYISRSRSLFFVTTPGTREISTPSECGQKCGEK